ncbi:MAG: M16 family metallopeptidase [Myxococcota bacterium]|nr:pitrilysin family protein [Myxococcota bacterium]
MRRTLVSLLSVLAFACGRGTDKPVTAGTDATSDAAQAFRLEQPKAAKPKDFVGPVPTRTVLPSGLTVMVIEKHELPLVAVHLVVRSGTSADTKGHEGIAQMVANMLQSGTTTRKASDIDEAIETLGTQISSSTDLDGSAAFVQVLRDNLPQAFDVLADVIQNPTFPADELERVRAQMTTNLLQERDSPPRLASRTLLQTIYGDHPYGRSAAVTPDGLAKVKRDELKAFHAKHYRPGNAAIIIVGDITSDEATKLVESRFGGWKGSDTPPPIGPVAARKPGIILVPKAGAAQAQILAGHVGVPRSDPDFYALVLANLVLGGQFNSRINMNLREQKGFTYGASSAFNYGRGPGAFFVATSTRPEVAAPAIHEILLEIRKIRQSGVTEQELEGAKSNYIESLPGEFDTVRSLARMVGTIYMYDLPLDYYGAIGAKLREVSIDHVAKAVKDHIDDDKLEIVVVGDEGQLKAQLEALGQSDMSRPVEVRPPPAIDKKPQPGKPGAAGNPAR